MATSEEDFLEKAKTDVKRDVKRLKQEIVSIRQELNTREGMSGGRVLQLFLKEDEFNLKKLLCESLDPGQVSLMAACEEDFLEKAKTDVKRDVKRLKQEIVSIRQELNTREGMSGGRVLQLFLKEDEFNLKKLLCECLDPGQTRSACGRESLDNEKLRQKFRVDLGYYPECFHSYIADKMGLSWPDLACVLSEEPYQVRDGAWWGAKLYVEFLGHLEDLGFTKEQRALFIQKKSCQADLQKTLQQNTVCVLEL